MNSTPRTRKSSQANSPPRNSIKLKKNSQTLVSMESSDDDLTSVQEHGSPIQVFLRRSLGRSTYKVVEKVKHSRSTRTPDLVHKTTKSSTSRLRPRSKVNRKYSTSSDDQTPKKRKSICRASSIATRSQSRNKSTKDHMNREWSPIHDSPKSRKSTSNELPRTPKTQNKENSRTTIRCNSLTPSLSRRLNNLKLPQTPLQDARSRLHVSLVPKSLPCREVEFNDIYSFLEGKLTDKIGGCFYISGVPGTGKTATVNEAIKCLQRAVLKGKLDEFTFIEINGMKLTEPRQAYVQILKQLTNESRTWEQAQQILEKKFSRSGSLKEMVLLLVDELDLLYTKRQDVIYNILDWPTKSTAKLVVVTIANTMDLPERILMGRIASRLGLTRLTFHPYTHQQLQQIVSSRLKDLNAFHGKTIELISRKVSAVSGDARRALDICRRSVEIAELRGENVVSVQDVLEASTEMIAAPKVCAIKNCSTLEQLFLQAVSAEVLRTGVEEVYFKNVYNQLVSLSNFEGIQVPNVSETFGICSKLSSSRLLICEHPKNDIHMKIYLNVSRDDIHYALQ